MNFWRCEICEAKISHRDDGLFYVLSREAMESDRPWASVASAASVASVAAGWVDVLSKWVFNMMSSCGCYMMLSWFIQFKIMSFNLVYGILWCFLMFFGFPRASGCGFYGFLVIFLASKSGSNHLAHWEDGKQGKCSPLNLANLAWAFASAGWHGEMSTRRVPGTLGWEDAEKQPPLNHIIITLNH